MEKNNDKISWQDKHPLLISFISRLCRIAVGGTFIISGFLKAVDPYGSIYKIGEYISAMHLHGFDNLLVPMAFVLFVAEFMLGVFVLTGCYRKLSVWGVSLMMAFLLPLTVWIAVNNPVDDCGCFGDAFLLTNQQTLWKNIILSLMCVWLCIFPRKTRALIHPAIQWLAFIATSLYIVIIGFVGYNYQPLLDFRPYPIGSSLIDTESNDGADIMAVWRNGDKSITIPIDSIPESDEWEFVERVNPDSSAIKKNLVVYDDQGEDITEDIFTDKGRQIILFYPSLENLSSASFYLINSLNEYCYDNNIDFFAISNEDARDIDRFIDLSLAEYPIYFAEDTAIKEVVRGNPGVVYVEDGVVKWKSTLHSLNVSDFKLQKISRDPNSFARNDKLILANITVPYCVLMLLLLLFSQIPRVVKIATSKNKSRFVKTAATILLFPIVFSSCNHKEDEPEKVYKRTLLVYMVATNNLSLEADPDYKNGDIAEIIQGVSSVNSPDYSVIIYCDRPGENAVLYSVNSQENKLNLLKCYDGNYYSLDKMRFSEVMADMKRYSSAEEYDLFLWSHALSWLYSSNTVPGTAMPMSFGDDYGKNINIDYLAQAIPDDLFSTIWMDCCYMGSVEVAYQLRHKCRYYVGYPTRVMGPGAPYNLILPHLLSERHDVVSAAEAMYRYYAVKTSSPYCTISVVNTDALSALADRCRQIVKSGGTINDLNLSGQRMQTYGVESGVTLYDFAQYMRLYANRSGNGALLEDFEEDFSRAVIYKESTPRFISININKDMFSGLSVHIPGMSTNNQQEQYYKTLDWWYAVYE